MLYNWNEKLKEGPGIEVGLNNRALNYGDGVFESMKYANKRINFWEDHYFRLMASMRILRMEIPISFSPEYLEEQVKRTLSANNLEESAARVRLQVIRKAGGLYEPATNEVDFLITVSGLSNSQYVLNERGLEIDLFKDYFKSKSLLSTIKSSSAQFYALASIFKKENQLDECLLLNDDKSVVEAISANVFLVKGEKVYTPPLSDGCLKGVMRKKVMELLPQIGYEVEEKSFSPFEIQKADELFLTNASTGIRWAGKYRKKSFGKSCSEKLVKRLNVAAAIG